MKKKVLILSYSSIDNDPRVLRQIQFFKKLDFEIMLSGIQYSGDYAFLPIIRPKNLLFRFIKLLLLIFRSTSLRRWEFSYHSSLAELKTHQPPFDMILANDVETWPIGVALKNHMPTSKLVFDAHEHYTKHFSDVWKWNWFHKPYITYSCEKFIPKADKFITVCDGIGQEYEKDYGVQAHLILNTPDYEPNLSPSIKKDKIQIIHHGIANRSRKIEKMVYLMDHLDDRFELKLILVPIDFSYYEEIKELAKGKAVEFLDPVPTQEISNYINKFDIGLFILEPVNFNYEMALPNKFFEFIQARLAIAIGPSPEMSKIVLEEQNGIVVNSFDEKKLGEALNAMSWEEIQKMKEISHQIAGKYSNHQNEKVMESLLQDLGLLNVEPSLESIN